jgi:hypothetical protein
MVPTMLPVSFWPQATVERAKNTETKKTTDDRGGMNFSERQTRARYVAHGKSPGRYIETAGSERVAKYYFYFRSRCFVKAEEPEAGNSKRLDGH